VNGLDFSQSGAAATTQKEADAFWRTESIKDTPNMESVINAGDRFWESYDDGYIDNAFGNEINKISSLEDGAVVTAEILDAMSGFGVNSINDIDTREEKEAFMSLSKFNTLQGDVGGTTDQIFDDLMVETSGTDAERYFTDPKLEGVTKQWILDNVVIGNNFEIDEKTGQAIITGDALPPWDERSEQFTFMTWPRATWDAEGNRTDVYSGQEFRDDLDVGSVHNDPAAIAEDKALTDAYLKYEKESDDPLPWLDWYNESQGNTKEVFGPTGSSDIILDPNPGEKIDNLDRLKLHVVDKGLAPTEEEVLASLSPIDSLDNAKFFQDGSPSAGISNSIDEAGGWINYKGKALKYEKINGDVNYPEDRHPDDGPVERGVHTFTNIDGETVGKDFDNWLEWNAEKNYWEEIEKPSWV